MGHDILNDDDGLPSFGSGDATTKSGSDNRQAAGDLPSLEEDQPKVKSTKLLGKPNKPVAEKKPSMTFPSVNQATSRKAGLLVLAVTLVLGTIAGGYWFYTSRQSTVVQPSAADIDKEVNAASINPELVLKGREGQAAFTRLADALQKQYSRDNCGVGPYSGCNALVLNDNARTRAAEIQLAAILKTLPPPAPAAPAAPLVVIGGPAPTTAPAAVTAVPAAVQPAPTVVPDTASPASAPVPVQTAPAVVPAQPNVAPAPVRRTVQRVRRTNERPVERTAQAQPPTQSGASDAEREYYKSLNQSINSQLNNR
ncbi:MAG: hypothetical protein ACXWJK_12840 [Burkholderiaceae bacterium]